MCVCVSFLLIRMADFSVTLFAISTWSNFSSWLFHANDQTNDLFDDEIRKQKRKRTQNELNLIRIENYRPINTELIAFWCIQSRFDRIKYENLLFLWHYYAAHCYLKFI